MERLTQYEREQIASLKRVGRGIREIAREIGRDHSVVSRELKRNTTQLFPYEATSAHRYAARRATKTNIRKVDKSEELRKYIRAKLRLKWSPEQIAGRLKTKPPKNLKGMRISHESIYQWIYAEAPHGEPWLYHTLRRKHPERRKQFSRKKRSRDTLKEITSISERPVGLGIGHFEVDSVIGRHHKGALSVHYERATQLVRIHHLTSTTAVETRATLTATIEDLPHGYVKSLTFDRGSETALHYTLKEPYNLHTYHCDPYSPHQKGGVENMNGLIRQFYPKKTDFTTVSQDELNTVQELLNDRPRKTLNYLTPNEIVRSGALNT
jgi:transposase, IS30 family